jgi:serine/threonine protein kinase
MSYRRSRHDDQNDDHEEREHRRRREDERRKDNARQWSTQGQCQRTLYERERDDCPRHNQHAAAAAATTTATLGTGRTQPPAIVVVPPQRRLVSLADDTTDALGRVYLLAKGGSGMVYPLAKDAKHVVKVMRIELATGIGADTLRELDVYAHTSSYHLACLRRAWFDEMRYREVTGSSNWGTLVLLLPRASYGDLLVYVDTHHLREPAQTAHLDDLLAQMLRSMAVLHAHHLVHTDLKTDNFLIQGGGGTTGAHLQVQLTDFGRCAQALPTIAPRKAYKSWNRAPEVWQDQSFGVAADVYALGCLVFELVCGERLFPRREEWHEQQEDTQAMEQTEERRTFIDDALPETLTWSRSPRGLQLVDLLTGMLDPDPTMRMSLPAALAHPFFAAVRAHPEANGPGRPLRQHHILRNATSCCATRRLSPSASGASRFTRVSLRISPLWRAWSARWRHWRRGSLHRRMCAWWVRASLPTCARMWPTNSSPPIRWYLRPCAPPG